MKTKVSLTKILWAARVSSRIGKLVDLTCLHHPGKEDVILEDVCKTFFVLVKFIEQVVGVSICGIQFLPSVYWLWSNLQDRDQLRILDIDWFLCDERQIANLMGSTSPP